MPKLYRWYCTFCTYEAVTNPQRTACPRCSHALERRLATSMEKLNANEIKIINLMVEGLRMPKIAERLGWSEDKVGRYLQEAREKTGTKTNPELVAECMRAEVIQ